MSRERELLRRLVEAWRDGGEASHSFEVLTQVLREAKALLAEPEGEEPTLRSMAGAAPDLTGGVESVEWLRRKRAAMEDNYAAYATPRSRAEAEAMLKLYDVRVETNRRYADEYSEKEMVAQRAALVAALTGGGEG